MRAECFKNVRIDQSGSGRDRNKRKWARPRTKILLGQGRVFQGLKVTELLQHH